MKMRILLIDMLPTPGYRHAELVTGTLNCNLTRTCARGTLNDSLKNLCTAEVEGTESRETRGEVGLGTRAGSFQMTMYHM